MPAKTKDSSNMELWDSVCETPPSITKQVNQRGGFTAICAQAQLKRATELWGPYGSTWGVTECHYEGWPGGNEATDMISIEATFKYPGGSFPITSDIRYKAGDDCFKKLLTDVTSKALSKLGFNSDIFEGKFDDNKYVAAAKAKEAGKAKAKANPNNPDRPITGEEAAGLTNLVEQKRKAAGFTSGSALDVVTAIRKDVLGDTRCQTMEHLAKLREAVESGNYDLDTGELINV